MIRLPATRKPVPTDPARLAGRVDPDPHDRPRGGDGRLEDRDRQ
jgi:hypothetical protein